jgi:hypothetical protein
VMIVRKTRLIRRRARGRERGPGLVGMNGTCVYSYALLDGEVTVRAARAASRAGARVVKWA